MTIEKLRKVISEACNDVTFVYNGKRSGVTVTVQNYVATYQVWHGDDTKEYKGIDTLLNDKFYSGKSIVDLVGHVNFKFC